MAFLLNKNLVSIDSMQFMNSSLDKLVKNLSDKDFKYLIKEFGSKNLELLKQKGVYPYEYMDSFEKFNKEKLPAKKYFHSSIKDYHHHYLKKDVLLLADVFENFIDTCLKYYGLDPCHYFSAPGLSWDAMVKNY